MANNIDAFLKARGKNHAEDVRLQQILATFELEKRQWERRVFNETYEQRNLAYSLRRDADDIQRKRKQESKRQGEWREAAVVPKNATAKLPRLVLKVSQRDVATAPSNVEELACDMTTLPVVAQDIKPDGAHSLESRKMSLEPLPEMVTADGVVLSGESGMSGTGGKMIITGKLRFARAVETLIQQNRTTKGERPAVKRTESLFDEKNCSVNPHDPLGGRVGFSKSSKKVDLADLVARLFPKSLRRARSMVDLEKLKEGSLTEVAPTNAAAPGVADAGEEDMDIDPSVSQEALWVGDPKAIGSVRRPRLPPQVMSVRSRNVGDVMKLIRDLPVYPSCSRNCNKPGASFDDEASASQQKTMMPSLVMANVAKQNNPLHTRSQDAINASSFEALPVIPDATFAAPHVQQQLQRSLEARRAALRRTQREILRKPISQRSERPEGVSRSLTDLTVGGRAEVGPTTQVASRRRPTYS